jgi:hypothetical protein
MAGRDVSKTGPSIFAGANPSTGNGGTGGNSAVVIYFKYQ